MRRSALALCLLCACGAGGTVAPVPGASDSGGPGAPSASVGDAATPPYDAGPPSAKTIGPSGGMALSSDGRVKVTVPTGALTHEVVITISPVPPPLAGALGQTYAVGPLDTALTMPLTLEFTYDPTMIDGNWPADLLIGTVVDGAWAATSTPAIDEGTTTVIAKTSRMGPFALIVRTRDWDAAAEADTHADATDAGASD